MTNTYVHTVAGSGGGGSGITALTGDVTASGTGSVTATISNNAVTYAKFQQVNASSLVGNPTGSLANSSEITLGTNLSFSGSTLNATGNSTFTDDTFLVENISDTTKKLNMNLAGQTTSTEMTIATQNTSNMILHVPQVATASGAGMALVQDETTGFIFSNGITSSIGGANSMMQLANATTANRAQIKLHSYFNGASVAGVSTLTSRSGVIGTNSAVVNGQDYSKWTAQAAATTPGSAPISGTWVFRANTVNSLTVTSDFRIQLTNLAGSLGDRFLLSSEGVVQLPQLTASTALAVDSSNNIVSSSTTSTELSYVHGVTSSIQTQLNTITSTVPPSKCYIDFLSGNDSTGTGSLNFPWKTLQHAYDTITDASINKPYVFYISGGNNDTDSSTITGKPNISLVADYSIQVNNLVISGGSTNDTVSFTNIIFLGGPTWIRNDGTQIGVSMIDCETFSGPTLKQTGTGGGLFVTLNNSETSNAEFLTPSGFIANGCTFLGTTTFDDPVVTSSYIQISSGYIGGAFSVSGGVVTYLGGVIADVPFGYTLTAVTTANGTPTFQTDSGSIPSSITGTPTLYLASQSKYEAYTPAISGNWTVQPTTVQEALDMIAAKIGPV